MSAGGGSIPPLSALWSWSLAHARHALGEEWWAVAFAAGQALSPEGAIAEVLGDVYEVEQSSSCLPLDLQGYFQGNSAVNVVQLR